MSFKKVPIVRGFTEIETLFNEVSKREGVICGGYARYCASPQQNPERGRDVDIFPMNEEAYEKLKEYFVKEERLEIAHENEISVSFKRIKNFSDNPKWFSCPQIQLIKPKVEGRVLTVGSMEAILSNFDFTVVRVGILSPTEALVDEDFEKDETTKTLNFKNIHCPISSTFRVIKYVDKGYWIKPFQILQLFLDWEQRDASYREQIADMLNRARTFDGKSGGISEEERALLYKLMRVD